MISHGSSTANTIANAIRTADEMSAVGIVDQVRAAVGAADA
jgi:fatty acid/phospholipid biosynthesis enzyme